MKLLIKIYIDNMNFYDLQQIIGALNNSITDKNTKIIIMTNDKKVKFDDFEVCYLKEISLPIMINHDLDKIDWDIILPITKPCILSKGFDSNILTTYMSKFHDFNGVLSLTNKQNDILNIIGKEYYKEFGHIYNPIYKRKNYENEFNDILNFNKKYYSTNIIKFKILELKTDDDNIYELRKKTNFGLTKK